MALLGAMVGRQALAQTPAQLDSLSKLSADDKAKALQALGSRSEVISDAPPTRQTTVVVDKASSPSATSAVTASASATAREGDLPLFGYSLFDGANSFEPSSEVPTPGRYVLGPGDVVRVQLFGNQNETLNLSVTRDGSVNFPKLGPIQVAGLAFDDARAVIERRVEKELIGVQTNITLGPLRGIQIFLLGNVAKPGAYTVSGLATITNALFAGGGVAPTGSLRSIQLKRGGRVVQNLDLYDFLMRGNSTGDARLQAGDVVFVPSVGQRFAVAGAVRRPAVYEFRGGLTVRTALDMAGGLLPSARRGQVSLERITANGQRSLRELDLSQSAAESLPVQDGDRLTIAGIDREVNNRVTVFGHVRYPNTYAWSRELTLSRLIALAQVRSSEPGLELYPVVGLIERADSMTGLRDWRSFDLAKVESGEQDQALKPEDRVVVLTRADVAYLNTPAVRNALAGRLPKAISEQEQTAKTVTGATTEKGLAGNTEDVIGKTVQASRSDGVCPGLVELVKIADSSRAQDIRVQLETQATATETGSRVAMVAERSDQSCPEVFRRAPTALPYLLEHAVGLSGEVRRPGIYPFPEGSSLSRMIAIAGGETTQSDVTIYDLLTPADAAAGSKGTTRFLRQTRSERELSGPAVSGTVLRFIPAAIVPEVGSVEIRGEVRFPGRYVISRGDKLTDLLSRAGGLTTTAYPYGAVFTRESARATEMLANQRAATDLRESLASAATKGLLGSNAVQGQSASAAVTELAQKLEGSQAVGRVVVEADPGILAARPSLDFLLEPGDALVIPKRPNSVAVNGQVLNPGSLTFNSGAHADDYIRQAGGFAQAADEKRTYLILPNGVARPVSTSWLATRSEAIPPGSVVVVPRDVAPYTGLLLTERISSILSNLALSAAALVTINR